MGDLFGTFGRLWGGSVFGPILEQKVERLLEGSAAVGVALRYPPHPARGAGRVGLLVKLLQDLQVQRSPPSAAGPLRLSWLACWLADPSRPSQLNITVVSPLFF